MEGAGEKGFKTTGSFAMIYQIIRNEGFLVICRRNNVFNSVGTV